MCSDVHDMSGDGATAVIIIHYSDVIWVPNHQKFHCLLEIVGGVSNDVRIGDPLCGCSTSDLYIPRFVWVYHLWFPRTHVMTSLCVVVVVATTRSYEFDGAVLRVLLVLFFSPNWEVSFPAEPIKIRFAIFEIRKHMEWLHHIHIWYLVVFDTTK